MSSGRCGHCEWAEDALLQVNRLPSGFVRVDDVDVGLIGCPEHVARVQTIWVAAIALYERHETELAEYRARHRRPLWRRWLRALR